MVLFNSHILSLHKKRAQKILPAHSFLTDHVERELQERISLSPQALSRALKLSSEEVPSGTFDLLVSCLHAHWINNLPHFLRNIRQALEPNGLFLGALWGGQSLHELRESLLQAEISLTGGAHPRIAPMIQPADAPFLLSQAGFSNPIVEIETLTVTYPSLFSLMKDLRGMGESNALHEQKKTFTSRRLFEKAEAIYKHSFGLPNGFLPVTVQILYLTGWGPEKKPKSL